MRRVFTLLIAAALLLGSLGTAQAWGRRGNHHHHNHYNRGCGYNNSYYNNYYPHYRPTYYRPVAYNPYYYPTYYPSYYNSGFYVNVPGVVSVGIGPGY